MNDFNRRFELSANNSNKNVNIDNPENIKGYDIREQSAVGLHGCCTYFYKTTVLPYHNGCLPKDSIILHMPKPNNHSHSKILFDDGIQF